MTDESHGGASTHLYREPSPAGAELEKTVAGLDARGLEHVMDFPLLGGLEVAVCRAVGDVPADAALVVGP